MNYLYRVSVIPIILFAFISHSTYSQSITQIAPTNGEPFYIQVAPKKSSTDQAFNIIKENLPLGANDQLVPLEQQNQQAGFTLNRFQQYYKGIKVEHGIYKVHNKNGITNAISGELYEIPSSLNIQPSLSKEEAVQHALSFVGAKLYKWQVPSEEAWLKQQQNNLNASYYPKGELVICKAYRKNRVIIENGDLTLAYKFDVFAQEPLSRAYVYVDAQTGNIIHQDAIIKHADGIGHTRYSGQRTISTTLNNSTYQLRDISRGLGVETYNMQAGTTYGSAIDFTDSDNQWTTAEHGNIKKDNAALDCHWGAMKTYDYFKNVHGRNSFDGNGAKLKCYVHYSNSYVNAFWNGSVMTFGDGEMTGNTGIQPLTVLDITAHEIGHAVCEYTANLVYSYESGAMNEGFSDIWGAMVEYYADSTKAIWTIGEDANFTIRSMSNPNAFQHPDTYKGQYWYAGSGDNGGVHYNSGVLNHWFYLLCIGKTGTNDNGDNYNVTGISMQKAARIAYRTESIYLTSNSQYKDARTFSIQAAIDLFGANSQEAIQTANAWYAVGVYDTAAAPSNLTATTISGTQINLSWTDNATNETGFSIERSTIATSGFAQIATVASNVVTYQDKNLVTNAVYYYRVKANLGTSSSTYSNIANATVGIVPIIMSNTSVTTCTAVFMDPGGTGNYGDYQYVTQTLTPATTGKMLQVAFSAFDTEASYDYVSVYDGSSTYAPLLGTFSGTTLPPTLTAANASGQLTFFFYSNSYTNRAGWQATLSCVNPLVAPSNLVATTFSATQVNLSWTDNAADETGFLLERSTNATTGFVQIATVGANVITYANTGLVTDARYYYRVRAMRGTTYSLYSNVANTAVGTAPLIMSSDNITICDAVFLDPGGAGSYENAQNLTMILTPATAGKMLRVTFASFSLYYYYDYLSIYDGATTNAPLIGTYSGSTLPPTITASNATGQLTFRFYSYGNSGAGWQASLSCVSPTAPTITLLSPARNSRNISNYSNLAVSFSHPMQTTTASATTIKIHGSQTGLRTTPTGGYFSGAGTTTATFDPATNLKAGEVVSVTITTNAKNNAGLAIPTPQVYHFTTASASAPANFVANAPTTLSTNPFGLVAADFDKDGDLDLASPAYLAAGQVTIRMNNGSGVFTGSGSVAVGNSPRALAVADFDNDGDVDLAAANSLSNDVSIRFNAGTGLFSGTTQVAVGTMPTAVVAADLDGDGDMDLASANLGDNTLSVRFNNGAGLFTGTTQVAVGGKPAWVQAADLDGDGDLDLATANYGAHTVSVRFNNGAGGFTGGSEIGVGLQPTGLVLADIDGDGDLDLASANSGAGTLSVRFNNGLGAFTGSNEVSMAGGAWAVVAADLDGDGDMDLASANAIANNVSVRLNNGLGVFTGTAQVVVGTTPRSLIAADLDGDQDLDLATANFASNSCSTLLNVLPLAQSEISPRTTLTPGLQIGSTQESKAIAYPNPFKDEIKLMIKSEQTQEAFITIADAYGKVIYTISGNTTNQEISIANHLPLGVYLLQVSYGDKVEVLKITKSE